MNATADTLVIGGGIVGAACAHALSAAGIKVRLLERSFAASGTSRACDGLILFFDKLTDAELRMARDSAALWGELSVTLPADFHYARRGSVVVAETEAGLSVAAQKASRLAGAGLRADVLDAQGLAALEPCLAPDLAGGVFYPDEAQVDSRLATVALLQAARRLGAEIEYGVPVTGLRRTKAGARVAAVTPKGDVLADAVVLAAGVWSAELAQTIDLTLPVKPRKGHILVSTAAPGLLAHPLLEGGYAASVQSDSDAAQVALVAEMTPAGTLLLGSSREFAGYDTTVSAPVAAAIAARALRFIPSLARSNIIRSYAGLRPWSPDHLPLIGPVNQTPGLFLATGHEGAGIGLAPITGRLIANCITGGPLPEYAHAVRPDRFALSARN